MPVSSHKLYRGFCTIAGENHTHSVITNQYCTLHIAYCSLSIKFKLSDTYLPSQRSPIACRNDSTMGLRNTRVTIAFVRSSVLCIIDLEIALGKCPSPIQSPSKKIVECVFVESKLEACLDEK